MNPGTRLKSATCTTEVVVIRHDGGTIECGGVPMAEQAAGDGTPAAGRDGGTIMGKRYADARGTVELLCVKPGRGTLSLDGVPLTPKEAKPLPASD